MAEVIMLVATTYGSTIQKGDVVDVPDEVAERWVKHKIAKYAEPRNDSKDSESGQIDYASYRASELQQIAKEREIEGWSSMKKEELVQALQQDDRQRG